MREFLFIQAILLVGVASASAETSSAPTTAPTTAPAAALPAAKVYPPLSAGAMTVGELARRWKDPRIVERLSAVDFRTRLDALDPQRPARAAMLEQFFQPEAAGRDSLGRKWLGSADSAEPFWALLELGPGRENIPALVRLLKDPMRNPRLTAGLLEALAPDSVRPVAALLAEKEWYARWAGGLALGVMGPKAAAAEPAVEARLADTAEAPIVRAAAARALARIRGTKVAGLIQPWPDLPAQIIADVRKKAEESKKAACEWLADQPPPAHWLGASWVLASLYLNRNVEAANRLLIETLPTLKEGEASSYTLPHMASTYARILVLFHSRSRFFPGRLSGPAEKALKELLWAGFYRKAGSVAMFRPPREMAPDCGQAEHLDTIACSTSFFTLQVLRDDPDYQDRALKDGLLPKEHYAARAAWWKERMRFRATHGLWTELGASYSKHTFSSLANFCDLAEDAGLRQRAKMLLDVALVEEEQVSLNGARGGHKTHALGGGPHNELDWYKQPLYGERGGGLFHRIFETGPYEAPEAAILLRHLGADEPTAIQDHHLGRHVDPPANSRGFYLAHHPLSVFYAWRTPRYILGSRIGEGEGRCWAGMLFASLRSVATPAFTGQKVHFQHRNVMFAQNQEKLPLRIDFSPGLGLLESGGWIFADGGDAYVAVRAGEVDWDEAHVKCWPKDPRTALIFHAGDVSEHGSFEKFVRAVLSTRLRIEPVLDTAGGKTADCRVEYSPAGLPKLEFVTHLPSMIGGEEFLPDPPQTYSSPFLECEYGSDKVTARFGKRTWVYDFGTDTIR